MAVEQPDIVIAQATVLDGTFSDTSLNRAVGCVVTRVGVGSYILTLGQAVDVTRVIPLLTITEKTNPRTIRWFASTFFPNLSVTALEIHTTDLAGADVDAEWVAQISLISSLQA